MSENDFDDDRKRPAASLTATTILKKRGEKRIRTIEDLDRLYSHISAFDIHQVSYVDLTMQKPSDHVRLREELMRRIVAEDDAERRQEMVRRLDERCAELKAREKAA